MNDLSFIRLEPNFTDAKFTRPSTFTTIYRYGQIVLKTDETYLQTTNTPLGISFDGNYAVYIVDCNDVVLQTITDNVAINERTINGLPQIDFEVTNLGTDYYAKTVFFKFVHTVSNYVWYSNPLNITNYYDGLTTRFDYKNATDTFYQSIRLGCYFTVNDAESQSSEYVTYDGKKLTSRLINTELEKYIFDKIDNFTYRRLNNLLSRNVVYINGYRVTDKQTLPSKDKLGDTNYFDIDFKVAIDYNESYTAGYQIFEALAVVSLYPINGGIYTVASFTPIVENSLELSFNKTVNYVDNPNVKVYKDGILVIDANGDWFNVDDNTIGISNLQSYFTFINGSYSIVIEPNQIFTPFENWQGFEFDDWTFTIVDGEFSATDFDNTEFLTT